MKPILAFVFVFLAGHSISAQNTLQNTSEFVVEGLVRAPMVINLDSIKGYESEIIDSLVITNHLGQRKSTLKGIRGVPMKRILEKTEILAENPKALSEFYFVFIASDDYKVVFSWNELFNSPVGAGVYLITERDGKTIDDLDGRITVFSKTDTQTGRRYVKGLKKIVVKRAE